ncbi:MAG: hypothetical protein RKE49_00055 [Oceanicaulis sp.]
MRRRLHDLAGGGPRPRPPAAKSAAYAGPSRQCDTGAPVRADGPGLERAQRDPRPAPARPAMAFSADGLSDWGLPEPAPAEPAPAAGFSRAAARSFAMDRPAAVKPAPAPPRPALSDDDAAQEARWIAERVSPQAEPVNPEIRTGRPAPEPDAAESAGEAGPSASHAVFDRMGRGMAQARAFELGELEIERRFDTLEQSLALAASAPAPAPAARKPARLDDAALARELAAMAAEAPDITRAPADAPARTVAREDDAFERALANAAADHEDFDTRLHAAADGPKTDAPSSVEPPAEPRPVPRPDGAHESAPAKRAVAASAPARPVRFIPAGEALSAAQAGAAMLLARIHGLPPEAGPIARGEGGWALYEGAFTGERPPRAVFDAAGLAVVEAEILDVDTLSEPLSRGPVAVARKRDADTAMVVTARADGADGAPAFLTLDPTGSGAPETLTLTDLAARLTGAGKAGPAGMLLAYADG